MIALFFAAVLPTCVPSKTFNVTMLLSIVRLYFLSSPLFVLLIAVVLFVFGPLGSLLYERIHPLSVLQGPVPLQTNEETLGYARTTSLTVNTAELHFLSAQVAQQEAENLVICSIFVFIWVLTQLSAMCYIVSHVHKNRTCIFFVSVSPTMLLLVNNPRSRSPTQKLLCDGD